jgi:single-stranded-DNA-specific exonuclease
MTPLSDAWIADAGARFGAWLDGLSGAPLILCHDDADGLSSGALLRRALLRRGMDCEVRLVGRGENAWSDTMAAEVAERDPPGVIVADLGMRDRTLHPRMAVIDHHVPTVAPEGACVVHGYGLDPVPTTSLLAWWAVGAPDDLLWLAAVGVLGDLGDKAPFDVLSDAKKHYRAGKLREVTTLVNAPRRGASGDGRPALELLLSADDPADALSGRHPGLDACEAAREEVKAAPAEARRQPPRFGSRHGGDVAMIRVDTPCQVHPMVAQSWIGRLNADFVLCANFGYLDGAVAMSGRARGDADLLDFLRRHRPEGADPLLYGNGHRRAAGGTLSPASWNVLVHDLGFGPEMRA